MEVIGVLRGQGGSHGRLRWQAGHGGIVEGVIGVTWVGVEGQLGQVGTVERMGELQVKCLMVSWVTGMVRRRKVGHRNWVQRTDWLTRVVLKGSGESQERCRWASESEGWC
jgi:hypothetical protein